MNFDNLFSSTNISASGLSAERFRMEVVANNIANASSTRTAGGGPYRRQEVVFASVLDETLSSGGGAGRRGASVYGSGPRLASSGVQVVGLEDDPSALHRIHSPGHPDADADGFVTMPNVDLPVEMVNLITASRAYEANLRAMQTFRQMAEQSLALLKA
jgi:flagellar basal-body rod protein FlgC